jgi:hypothetical protein
MIMKNFIAVMLLALSASALVFSNSGAVTQAEKETSTSLMGPCAYNLDFNCNGCVNVEDLLLLLGAVGSVPSSTPNSCGSTYDLDGDGDIDRYDVIIFKDNYNSCAGC